MCVSKSICSLCLVSFGPNVPSLIRISTNNVRLETNIRQVHTAKFLTDCAPIDVVVDMASSKKLLSHHGGGTTHHQRAGLDNKPAHGLSTACWNGDLWNGSEYRPPGFKHNKLFCLATFTLSPIFEDLFFEHRFF